MLIPLVFIIITGVVGAVAFLNLNEGQKLNNENEADEYDITEVV